MKENISYCMSTCEDTKCVRNKIHKPPFALPQTYGEYKGTKFCPTYAESEEKKEDMWPWGNMELGNFFFGHSRGQYPVERFPAQDYFGAFLDTCGFDTYGHPVKDAPISSFLVPLSSDGACEVDTEVFSLFPYYWGGDETLLERPNFVYKPEGIAIQWYKYPLRDAYSNVELTTEKLLEILEACTRFVKGL